MSLNLTNIKTIRMFGLIVTLFFGCLSALGLWKEKPLPTYLFGILSFIGFGFLIIPNSLRPVYMGWLRTAHLMGKVFTTLILVLVYYFVITPSGLIKRIIGGPPLPLKPDPDSSSYWVDRIEPAQPKERYAKRY